jgi:hypothetical protein
MVVVRADPLTVGRSEKSARRRRRVKGRKREEPRAEGGDGGEGMAGWVS